MADGRLAVIPARGGSKRIPRKNIKMFAGKPMIAYAIEAGLATGIFDRVIVSTDDQEIAEISLLAGAEVPFVRPLELSDDMTPTVPVITHAIESCKALGWQVNSVCCIYPCVPFIEPADIAAALDLLESGVAPYAFPVTSFPSPIQRALKRDSNARVTPFNPQYVNVRSQDLEPAYQDTGQFYWGTAHAWLNGLNIHANGATIIIPEWRVVDIDTPDDWRRAEAMIEVIRR
jgi:pseudaminic acid cytidylyltransferase